MHLLSRACRKKIENFERYRRLYPEYGFVFLGDNGQADAEVANHIRAMYPHLVKAAFIHVVQPAAHDTIEVRIDLLLAALHGFFLKRS